MDIWNGCDQEAAEIFHGFFQTEYEKLVRCAIIYLKVKNTGVHMIHKAEDVVQETFASAWVHRQEILTLDRPVGWLYAALQYKVKELLKEENKWEKRLRRYKENYISPNEPHINLKLELDGIVSREDFDLLWKIYVIGYSYQELCRETGLTKRALESKTYRARKKIREQLEE